MEILTKHRIKCSTKLLYTVTLLLTEHSHLSVSCITRKCRNDHLGVIEGQKPHHTGEIFTTDNFVEFGNTFSCSSETCNHS